MFLTDIQAPTLTCPSNETIATGPNQPTAMATWTAPVATDNSNLTPNVTCSAENGSRFEIGETEVKCKAVDEAGNQANCSFIVHVIGK